MSLVCYDVYSVLSAQTCVTSVHQDAAAEADRRKVRLELLTTHLYKWQQMLGWPGGLGGPDGFTEGNHHPSIHLLQLIPEPVMWAAPCKEFQTLLSHVGWLSLGVPLAFPDQGGDRNLSIWSWSLPQVSSHVDEPGTHGQVVLAGGTLFCSAGSILHLGAAILFRVCRNHCQSISQGDRRCGRERRMMVEWELCVLSHLPPHHNRAVQRLQHYPCCSAFHPPHHHHSLTPEHDPELLELFHLGQECVPHLNFPTLNHGLRGS